MGMQYQKYALLNMLPGLTNEVEHRCIISPVRVQISTA